MSPGAELPLRTDGGRSIRVLHVDDDPELRALAADSLERESAELSVISSPNGSAGLELLESEPVDCIVSDYQMPGMDGLAFLEAVRADYPNVPFILFTGRGSEEIASEAISAGVTDYLQKGIGLDQYTILANRIENAVAKARAESAIDRTHRRYQQLIKESSDVIMVVDEAADFDYLSPAAERVLGYHPEELVGENGFDYVHPDDRQEAARRFRGYLEDAVGERPFTFRFVRPDGSWIWLEVRNRDLLDDPLIGGIVVYARDVTDRYEQIAVFEALVEHTSDIISVVDQDGVIQFESPAAERILGYEPAALIGENALEHVHPDDRKKAVETMTEAMNSPGESIGRVTYRFQHRDGSWVWLESVGKNYESPLLDGVVISSRDVTEQRAQRQKLETVVDRVTDAIVEVDREWRFTRVNGQAESIYEMTEDELLGRNFWDVFASAKGTRFETEYRSVMETREPASFTEYYSGLDGWFDIDVYPTDGGGLAFYFVDVTDRRKRERELQRQADRFEAFSRAFPDLAFIVDADGRYLDLMVGDDHESLLFDDVTELLGRTAEEVLPAEIASEFTATVQTVIETGEERRAEYTLEVPRGERRFEAIVEPLPFQYDGSDAAVWVARDVTERWNQAQLLDQLREHVQDVVWMSSPAKDSMDFISDSYEDVWGRSTESLLAEPASFVEAIHPDDRERMEQALEAQQTDPDDYEETYRVVKPDGEVRWVHDQSAGIYDDGDLVRIVGVATDVTERRKRARDLQRKNERLEEFASIVSHDLRNPLTVLDGSLELAAETGDTGHFERANRAVDRMKQLVDDLLTLARQGESVGAVEPVQLADLVMTCWDGVDSGDATIEVDCTRVVQADRSRLRQAVENLLRNAIEHAGSDVTITVGDSTDGFYIEDDGPGVSVEDRERVFEGGFSTDSDGTGFGLTIVRQVAEAHGWSVRATAGAAGGTRFEFIGVGTEADSSTAEPTAES